MNPGHISASLAAWFREHRVPLVVFTVAAACLFLSSRFTPKQPLLVKDAWTLLVLFPLPVLAAWLLDARRQGSTLIAALGGVIALTPVVWRTAVDKTVFEVEPMLLLAPALVSGALLVLGLKAGGVSLDRWGLGLGDWRWWLPRTALALLLIVGFSFAAAWLFPSLRDAYPWYAPARTDGGQLAIYLTSLGLYLVGWEFFYRGFMLFGVARNTHAVTASLVQAIPFMLLHRGKPHIEMVSSFFGGFFLGLFCYRARSFWPAVFLHWGLNASLQVICFTW